MRLAPAGFLRSAIGPEIPDIGQRKGHALHTALVNQLGQLDRLFWSAVAAFIGYAAVEIAIYEQDKRFAARELLRLYCEDAGHFTMPQCQPLRDQR